MNQEKIAIFEEINSAFYPVVDKYLKNDFTIYFFQMDGKLEEKQEFKKLLENKKIIYMPEMEFEYTQYLLSQVHAHKNVDYIFDKYFSHSSSIKLMEKLLKFPEIENMYKKELLMNLQKIYETELRINEIVKNNNFDEVYFYPTNNFRKYLGRTLLLNRNVKVIHNNNLRVDLKHILSRMRKILMLGLLIGLFFKRIKGVSSNKKQREFKVGIKLNLPGLFSYYYNYIRFIVDDYGLPQNEVLFIDEYGPFHKEICKNRGSNYVDVAKMRESITLDLFRNKFIKAFLPTWIKCFLVSFIEKEFVIEVTRTILADYITWNIFADSYLIHNHVTILLPDTISRNHILSQNNIKTWFIYQDNSAGDYHTGWDETIRVVTLFSFMYYDYAVIYGDKIRRYFQNNRNNIREYIKVGVLPSQIVYDLQQGKLESALPSIMKKKSLPKKIIGVFDTTFVDWGPVKIKDGIRFGNDILRLLNEMPDIGIIFKEKKHISFTPQLAPVYDKLKNHERCIFIPKTEEVSIHAPEVIAESELTISAAYTSTTAEALGAKKRAIYYDVAGHDIGDNYYFNRFPHFVAHSYEELKKLVHYWLYEVTEEEFRDFLNTYVKDEIDPYLDGKAISRLRKLLMEAKLL